MKRMIFSRLSIGKRLTLMICVLLLSVILIFGLMSYYSIKRAELKSGEDRLKVLSEQISSMLTGNTRSFITNGYQVSNKPGIIKLIENDGTVTSDEVMEELKALRNDTFYVKAFILDADRKTIYSSGLENIDLNISLDSILTDVSIKPDTGRVGKLYRVGDSVYFPIVSTVFENNNIKGFLVRWRMMNVSPVALAQLKLLLGSYANLYIGNSDGITWTDLQTAVTPLPVELQNSDNLIFYNRNNNPVVAHVRPVQNSKWQVAIEMPKAEMLGAANQFLYWLFLLGSLLLVLGIIAAWLMGKKITHPLRELTAAVSGIAAGNYTTLEHLSRPDELGKLARAFNAMSKKVQHAQQALEDKARNYRLLFEHNPMPMWILSKATLDIMNVNEAAINHYGYTHKEFTSMNSKELRPVEDLEKYMHHVKHEDFHTSYRSIWRHKKKDGEIIMVEVTADNILYHGQPARLILAYDVTDKLNAEAQLIRHRVMEKELISETTIQAQEKEREELGKELHDNINQILASTKLYLEMAIKGDGAMVVEAVEKSYNNVNLAIIEIRRLSKQLVAPSLETSLVSVIRELSEEIEAITPISTSLVIDKFQENLLDDNLKLMLYRIIQEQVNNILKHAAADNFNINMETEHGIVYLIISDNGVGFDTAKKSKGIGLRNIENRVKFYDGQVNITSSPGKGTRLEISIPIERNAKLAM